MMRVCVLCDVDTAMSKNLMPQPHGERSKPSLLVRVNTDTECKCPSYLSPSGYLFPKNCYPATTIPSQDESSLPSCWAVCATTPPPCSPVHDGHPELSGCCHISHREHNLPSLSFSLCVCLFFTCRPRQVSPWSRPRIQHLLICGYNTFI